MNDAIFNWTMRISGEDRPSMALAQHVLEEEWGWLSCSKLCDLLSKVVLSDLFHPCKLLNYCAHGQCIILLRVDSRENKINRFD